MSTMLLLPAAVTAREANDTRRLLGQAMAAASGPGPIVVDASNLKRFDSSALAVLLDCERSARACGRPMQVRAMPAKLISLARLYGIDSLIELEPAPG